MSVIVQSIVKITVLFTLLSSLIACGGAPAGGTTASVNTGSTGTADNSEEAVDASRALAAGEASPDQINLAGSGGITSSTVSFTLTDGDGDPVAGQSVSFALSSTSSVGGARLADGAEIGTTNNQGIVRTVVESGTVATVVNITASVSAGENETPINASARVTISAGPAIQSLMSISSDNWNNAPAFNSDGVESSVTIIAGDRFGNPVQDGTRVSFISPVFGIIDDSCTIENGSCSVTWRSAGDRPGDGRAWILAHMEGTEEFIDANGNNAYDEGEDYTDIGEPCIDTNFDDVCSATEPYIDVNSDQQPNTADDSPARDQSVRIFRSTFIAVGNIFSSARLLRIGDNTLPPPGSVIDVSTASSIFNGLYIANNNTNADFVDADNNFILDNGFYLGSIAMPAGTEIKIEMENGLVNGVSQLDFPAVTSEQQSATSLGDLLITAGDKSATAPVTTGQMILTVESPENDNAGRFVWTIVD